MSIKKRFFVETVVMTKMAMMTMMMTTVTTTMMNLSASDAIEARCFLVSASFRKHRMFSPSRYLMVAEVMVVVMVLLVMVEMVEMLVWCGVCPGGP